MSVYITAISPSDASTHTSISSIRWVNSADSKSATMSMSRAVAWASKPGNSFVVASDTGAVKVQVVKADKPYLRTVANGKWADNLLALPSF